VAELDRAMPVTEFHEWMAFDTIEAADQQARHLGVPTVSDIQAMPPGRRLSAKDPDWFKKLEALAG